jgi:uncharacterized pyridoxal phosphate-dependent enzyme
MEQGTSPDVFKELGVRRVINAVGTATILGGTVLSPEMQRAMDQANNTFVSMEDLLDRAGRSIAEQLGVEAAYVTSGCFAAMALSAAGAMTGDSLEARVQLPDTTGLRNEFLIPHKMRYRYDRAVTVPGGKLLSVGDAHGTSRDQLSDAIGDSTAGVLFPAHLDGTEDTVTLEEVIAIAHDRGTPVIVDAAYQVYPNSHMMDVVASGADALCFSAKYMGGPNSVGFVCGKRELIEAASLNGFVAYEKEDNLCFGRGYKLDRQEVAALIVTLREWFKLDHDEDLRRQELRCQVIAEALSGLPHVRAEQMQEKGLPWIVFEITLDEVALGRTIGEVQQTLKDGDPSIWTRAEDGYLYVASNMLEDGEEHVVAERLREVLSS